jgi:hypothetical protein
MLHRGFPSRLAAILLFACLTSFTGCGPSPGAAVSGQVTLDGAPLDDATITFVPVGSGQRQAAWTTIKDGHYKIVAKDGLGNGQFRVEIRALRTTGAKANPNEPELINAREIVPGRYNAQSELTTDIKSGANTADFELKSK